MCVLLLRHNRGPRKSARGLTIFSWRTGIPGESEGLRRDRSICADERETYVRFLSPFFSVSTRSSFRDFTNAPPVKRALSSPRHFRAASFQSSASGDEHSLHSR